VSPASPSPFRADPREGWSLLLPPAPGAGSLPPSDFVFWFQERGHARVAPSLDIDARIVPEGHVCFGRGLAWELPSGAAALALVWDLVSLRQLLADSRSALDAAFAACLFGEPPTATAPRPLLPISLDLVRDLRQPPMNGAASLFWLRGRIQELLALQAFPPLPPVSRREQLASERAAKIEAFLRLHLASPLDFAALSRAAGCSPCHLCRTYSEHSGKTIRQRLRQLRIEAAARLLASGQCNVSEAAAQVGYHSLSHFSKAFLAETGCLPSRYPPL